MSYIASFVYCDQVQNNNTPQGVVRNIVTPLIELRPVNIPGNYTFSIACTIADIDIHKNNHFEFDFHDPLENIVNYSNISIPSDMLEKMAEQSKNEDSINIDLDLRNVVLKTEGLYKVVIKHNSTIIGEYPIKVCKGG